jgi:hypothetical protein
VIDPSTQNELTDLAKDVTSQSLEIVAKMKKLLTNRPREKVPNHLVELCRKNAMRGDR